MTERREGTGLEQYLALLEAVDGKTVRVTAEQSSKESQADFDRKVRESIDRQHRRARIAGGQS